MIKSLTKLIRKASFFGATILVIGTSDSIAQRAPPQPFRPGQTMQGLNYPVPIPQRFNPIVKSPNGSTIYQQPLGPKTIYQYQTPHQDFPGQQLHENYRLYHNGRYAWNAHIPRENGNPIKGLVGGVGTVAKGLGSAVMLGIGQIGNIFSMKSAAQKANCPPNSICPLPNNTEYMNNYYNTRGLP